MATVLRIHPADNVAMALSDLPAGASLELPEGAAGLPGASLGITTREAIPFGHKVALAPIRCGESVIKYGASIGLAKADIAPGQHVHVHNLRSVRGSVQR
jgi:altronate dehydratase